jgi:hypothetical protein
MMKPPKTGLRGRPWSATQRFRGWVASWVQDRRRGRQQLAPTPNAPAITTGGYEWGATDPAWADVFIEWSFDHGSFPVASIELWVSFDFGAYNLLDTVGSAEPSYYISMASNNEKIFDFKMRYRNGGIIGPFSNEYRVDVQV